MQPIVLSDQARADVSKCFTEKMPQILMDMAAVNLFSLCAAHDGWSEDEKKQIAIYQTIFSTQRMEREQQKPQP